MATDEPPPEFNEDANEEEEKEEVAPKKEKVPNEPPPDGEGELGPPFKRAKYIGCIVGIFAILAFWMPVYWMTSAVDPCGFRCNTYVTDYGGCYAAVNATKCKEDCRTTCKDVVYENAETTKFTYEQYALQYVATSREIRLACWTLITLGTGIAFVGAIIAYFAVKKGNPCLGKTSGIFLILGGLCLIGGGLSLAISWDPDRYDSYDGGFSSGDTDTTGWGSWGVSASTSQVDSDLVDINNAVHAAQFLEFLLPGVICIIFGFDIFKLSLNPERNRMLLLTIPFAIGGLYGGGVYAYIINWEPRATVGYENPLHDQLGCVAGGYFIFGAMCLARFLIAEEKVTIDDPGYKTKFTFIVSVLIALGGFICAVGYWAFLDTVFDESLTSDTDTTPEYEAIGIMYTLYGDFVGPSTLQNGIEDVNYESQFKCFYVGYSFFILGMTAIIAYDMDLVGNYKRVNAAE